MLKCRKTNNGKGCALLWDKEGAYQYWQMVHKTQMERINNTINTSAVTPQPRVLDGGPGPGVLAIPLAKIVCLFLEGENAAEITKGVKCYKKNIFV